MDASVSRPVWIPARPNMMPVRRRGISESCTLGVANRLMVHNRYHVTQ